MIYLLNMNYKKKKLGPTHKLGLAPPLVICVSNFFMYFYYIINLNKMSYVILYWLLTFACHLVF